MSTYNGQLDYWGTNIGEDPHDPIVKLVREMALDECLYWGPGGSCGQDDCYPCRARKAIQQRKDMVARR